MATTTNYSWNLPTVGGNQDAWGDLLNANWTAIDTLLGGTNATEFAILNGATVTTAELNILDGVTATTAEINTLDGIAPTGAGFGYVPQGGIIMWSGSIASVPSGWYLCDGDNGTPDLRNRFVVGAGDTYAVGATGGSADAIAVAHTHTYSGTTNTTGAHSHDTGVGGSFLVTGSGAGVGWSGSGGSYYPTNTPSTTGSTGDHAHTFSGTTASAGSSGTNANLPPYYALAYIMKA